MKRDAGNRGELRPIRVIKPVCFLLLTCLPTLAFAMPTGPAAGERILREECSAFSESGMRECVAKKAEASHRALRQAEQNVAGVLSKWDVDQLYVSATRGDLDASRREFARYRDAQCGFMASLSASGIGNSHEIRRLACVAALNNNRAQQLRDAVSNLRLK